VKPTSIEQIVDAEGSQSKRQSMNATQDINLSKPNQHAAGLKRCSVSHLRSGRRSCRFNSLWL